MKPSEIVVGEHYEWSPDPKTNRFPRLVVVNSRGVGPRSFIVQPLNRDGERGKFFPTDARHLVAPWSLDGYLARLRYDEALHKYTAQRRDVMDERGAMIVRALTERFGERTHYGPSQEELAELLGIELPPIPEPPTQESVAS